MCDITNNKGFSKDGYFFIGNGEDPEWTEKDCFTQSEVRSMIEELSYNEVDEEMVKYVYDLYTYQVGIKPIRKKKTRTKVKDEFRESNQSVKQAYWFMHRLVDLHKAEGWE